MKKIEDRRLSLPNKTNENLLIGNSLIANCSKKFEDKKTEMIFYKRKNSIQINPDTQRIIFNKTLNDETDTSMTQSTLLNENANIIVEDKLDNFFYYSNNNKTFTKNMKLKINCSDSILDQINENNDELIIDDLQENTDLNISNKIS